MIFDKIKWVYTCFKFDKACFIWYHKSMNINHTAYIETLKHYNQLSNLSNKRDFYDSFNSLYNLAQKRDTKFETECKNCVNYFNKFITSVRLTSTGKCWEEQIEVIIKNMRIWFSTSIKNLKAVYEEKAIKGQINESNFN